MYVHIRVYHLEIAIAQRSTNELAFLDGDVLAERGAADGAADLHLPALPHRLDVPLVVLSEARSNSTLGISFHLFCMSSGEDFQSLPIKNVDQLNSIDGDMYLPNQPKPNFGQLGLTH